MIDKLIFKTHPTVILGGNTFINIPTILQFEDIPLIEIIKNIGAGYTTQIPIYHPDGTYLAKVKGSRLFLTKYGEKAGPTLSHPDKMTICKLGEKTLFEIKRTEAAALKTSAELYTDKGFFVKFSVESFPELFSINNNCLVINNNKIIGCTFKNNNIGIKLLANGGVSMGIG